MTARDFVHTNIQSGSLQQVYKLHKNITQIISITTLKCLSIGTPKAVNFPFVSNEKLMFLSVPVFNHIVMRL